MKLSCLVGLFVYLFKSGKLDGESFTVLFQNPLVLLGALFSWFALQVCLGGLRLKLVFRSIGCHISYWKIVVFQAVGIGANLFLLGSVGGDVVKAYYVKREDKAISVKDILFAITCDRILGLIGLFIVTGLLGFLSYDIMSSDKRLGLMFLIVLLFAGFFVLLSLLMSIKTQGKFSLPVLLSELREKLSGGGRLFGFVGYMIELLLRVYKTRRIFWSLIGISMCIQVCLCLYIVFIAQSLFYSGSTGNFGVLSVGYALSALSATVPITPGGLGVGHVMFDSIVGLAGIQDGAKIFNVFVISLLFWSLFGLIPIAFLGFNRKKIQEIEDSL